MPRPGVPCVMGSLTLGSVRRPGDGVVSFYLLQTGLWEQVLSDPFLTYLFPTRLRHGASLASEEALSHRLLGHLGLSTRRNPSPPT